MNERIRECWLKAAREDSGEKWDTQEEFIERFARFIVQDCAEVCDLYGMPDGTSETASILSAAIKRKFGVE